MTARPIPGARATAPLMRVSGLTGTRFWYVFSLVSGNASQWMPTLTDLDLLRGFALEDSEKAFRTLVERDTGMVYTNRLGAGSPTVHYDVRTVRQVI